MKFITRIVSVTKLALKTHAPTIMVGVGVVSMGASVIAASRQTLQVEEVLSKHVPKLEQISHGEELGLFSYSSEIAAKDRFRVYSSIGVDMAKLYFLPAVLFGGGAALVFGGHHIMLKRNATLAIAFTSMQRAFDEYRKRVAEQYGDQADRDLSSPVRMIAKNNGDGTVTYEASTEDPEEFGYSRRFAQDTSTNWFNDRSVNLMFLRQQQRFAQERLNAAGHLYLSEVYSALGVEETPVSRVVGWRTVTLSDGSKSIPAIDFGLDTVAGWVGESRADVLLDFNCQGLIVGGKLQTILENL